MATTAVVVVQNMHSDIRVMLSAGVNGAAQPVRRQISPSAALPTQCGNAGVHKPSCKAAALCARAYHRPRHPARCSVRTSSSSLQSFVKVTCFLHAMSTVAHEEIRHNQSRNTPKAVLRHSNSEQCCKALVQPKFDTV